MTTNFDPQTTNRVRFYIGCYRPAQWRHFERVMVSVNQLPKRKLHVFHDCIMDSGAFTALSSGRGHRPVEEYARIIEHWAG